MLINETKSLKYFNFISDNLAEVRTGKTIDGKVITVAQRIFAALKLTLTPFAYLIGHAIRLISKLDSILFDKKIYPKICLDNHKFDDFAKPTPLTNALASLDKKIDEMGQDVNHPLWRHATTINHFFYSEYYYHLPVWWKEADTFINDSKNYIWKLEKAKKNGSLQIKPSYELTDQLLMKGKALVKEFIQTVDLELKTGNTFNPENFFNNFVASELFEDIDDFCLEVSDKTSNHARKPNNHPKVLDFYKIRESGNVAWPHSKQLRKKIEAAGFIFNPKEEKSVCETCNCKVKEWKLWDNPWLKHDASKHSPEFQRTINQMYKKYSHPV